MTKYEQQLKEVEMLIQREKLYPSKSELVIDKLIARRRQLLNLIKPEENATK
jgi:hypothetical protein